MGAITAYAMSVAIVLAVEYIIYKCLLANATFYRFNRFVILMCYVVALLAPLVRHATGGLNAEVAGNQQFAVGDIVATVTDTVQEPVSDVWFWIPLAYFAGAAVMAAVAIVSYARMLSVIRKGEKRQLDGAVLVVAPVKVSPFSWGKYLVVSAEDASNRLIIDHELSHIRSAHSLDLIFAQIFMIFNWFNPAAYLMRTELSAAHEYDVDARMLRSGVDAREYQMLLIRKTVGPGFQSIANSLNHSQLKNRLTMMLKSRSKSVRRLCAAALLPAAVLAVAMTDFPAVASTIANVAAVSLDKGSEKIATAQASETFAPAVSETPRQQPASKGEVMPKYPAGEQAMMQAIFDEIRFPEGKIAEGANGLVVVGFTVTADGDMADFVIRKSSGDAALDAEAIRAIKAALTKKWTPGTVDGRPVSVQYALPIRFAVK